MLRVSLLAVLLFATQASAEGPGSRIRATPLPPQPAGAIDKDLQRCEALRDDERERCLRALRDAARTADRSPHASPGPERGGPESTGMGSSAGSTSPSGVGGGGTLGGAAPR
ncbi:MAG TPA: hypothetical protein VD965_08035 [Burkholderiales bacterium]|nr:hypothetical protein [Burkholderiales bacterium]